MNHEERFNKGLSDLANSDDYDDYIYIGNDKYGSGKDMYRDYFPNETNLPKGECVCGHTLKHHYYIMNRHNKEVLIVGSGCVKKFLPIENRKPHCAKCEETHNGKRGLCSECCPRCPKCSGYLQGFDGICCEVPYIICRTCYMIKNPGCRLCHVLSCFCDNFEDIECYNCRGSAGKVCDKCPIPTDLLCVECIKKYTCDKCNTFDKNTIEIKCNGCKKSIKICKNHKYVTFCGKCYFVENRCVKCERNFGKNTECRFCDLSEKLCISCALIHKSLHKCKCGKILEGGPFDCMLCKRKITDRCEECVWIYCDDCKKNRTCMNCATTDVKVKNRNCKKCGNSIGNRCKKCTMEFCQGCKDKMCPNCFSTLNLMTCGICKSCKKICQDCTDVLEFCSICDKCMTVCEKCKSDKNTTCRGCKDKMCPNCFSTLSSMTCDICKSDPKICHGCTDVLQSCPICDKCMTVCEKCKSNGNTTCPECEVNYKCMRCHKSDKNIELIKCCGCDKIIKKCGTCKGVNMLCHDCIAKKMCFMCNAPITELNTCENCGILIERICSGCNKSKKCRNCRFKTIDTNVSVQLNSP